MNLSTIIALIIVIVLVVMASVYLYRHGTCGACPDAQNCGGHCSSEKKKAIRKDSHYKEKSDMIDEIIKKHRND